MQPTVIPIPPQLELAVGYSGNARFFGLSWGAGDEAYVSDGRFTSTGHAHGYLAFVRHPKVARALAGHDLGSTDCNALEWLVIDRHERKALIAPVVEARRFLREQWSETAGPTKLTQEEFARLVEQLQQDFMSKTVPTVAELLATVQAQQQLEREMVTWLDQATR